MNIFPFHFTCGKIMIILALTEHKIPASLFILHYYKCWRNIFKYIYPCII